MDNMPFKFFDTGTTVYKPDAWLMPGRLVFNIYETTGIIRASIGSINGLKE
jgi:hypothetical protein